MAYQATSYAFYTLIISLLMSLSICEVRSMSSIEPNNDSIIMAGGAASFLCKGDLNPGFRLDILWLAKTQIYNNSYGVRDQPVSIFPVVSVQNNKTNYYFPANSSRIFVSYGSTNSTSAELRINFTGLVKEDTATYACCSRYSNASESDYECSSPVNLIVYDRQPNITFNLVADIPIFKDNASGLLFADAFGIHNLTVYCNSSAVSLSPDVKLLVSGTDITTSTTKKVNAILTGNTPFAQIKTNEMSTAYTLVVAKLSGLCTTVTCSGYLPQYLGSKEIVSTQFTVKKAPGPCPTFSSSAPTQNDSKIWLTSVIASMAVLSLNVIRGL